MKTTTEFLAELAKLPRPARKKVVSTILDLETLTDAEVCETLRISPGQLRSQLREGPPRGRTRDVFDLRTVRQSRVGGSRLWLRASLAAAMNGDDE